MIRDTLMTNATYTNRQSYAFRAIVQKQNVYF